VILHDHAAQHPLDLRPQLPVKGRRLKLARRGEARERVEVRLECVF
jgi:hypothetical protein